METLHLGTMDTEVERTSRGLSREHPLFEMMHTHGRPWEAALFSLF